MQETKKLPDELFKGLDPQEIKARMGVKSYKVGVKAHTDTTWKHNALRFRTFEEAEKYGQDLAGRWLAVREWEVHPSEEEPNR